MKPEVKIAFQKTIPIMAGFLSLGIAYGILMHNLGYGVLWPFLFSLILYAGSMQFILLELLAGGASLLTIALTALFVNSRHIVYGISFLERFRSMGKKYPYMIHALSDETYSLLCSYEEREDLDTNRVFFLIGLFNHAYWVIGSLLGAILGTLITFDTTGVDFAMTALFVVIFLDQWKGAKSHIPACTGMITGIVCLLIFGPSRFILPTLLISIAILIALQKKILPQTANAADAAELGKEEM